jgi:flagellar FliL protein
MSAVMADPAADAVPARRPRKKLFVLAALVLVIALALAAAAVFYLKHRAARAAAAAEEEAATETALPAHLDPKSVPVYLPLDPFVVNLADRDADRYAQVGITFELDNGASPEQIKAYMPAIRNAILMILANKTSKELLHREGKEQLAQEILREAARPMGIDVAEPEPVTPAPSEAGASGVVAAGTAATPVAKKPRRSAGPRNPIQRVHFSSFIIQ